MKAFRQGDVYLREIPPGIDLNGYVETDNKTVAEGEVTGHHHTFYGGVRLMEHNTGNNLPINDRKIVVKNNNGSLMKEIIQVIVSLGYTQLQEEEWECNGMKYIGRYFIPGTQRCVKIPNVERGVLLLHQEHDPIIVVEGNYRRSIQREYSPEYGAVRLRD